jgi:hypothetical protein
MRYSRYVVLPNLPRSEVAHVLCISGMHLLTRLVVYLPNLVLNKLLQTELARVLCISGPLVRCESTIVFFTELHLSPSFPHSALLTNPLFFMIHVLLIRPIPYFWDLRLLLDYICPLSSALCPFISASCPLPLALCPRVRSHNTVQCVKDCPRYT